jgi:hypothetical protein
MPYITSVEQIGYDRGLQVGEESGAERQARSILIKQLTLDVLPALKTRGFWFQTEKTSEPG